jgi:YHS domain-containing protein
MLKKLMVICLSMALIASMGCSSEPQTEDDGALETDKTATGTSASKGTVAADAENVVHKDPVDGTVINDISKAKYSYVFDGRRFYFNSRSNMDKFKKDPRKYLLELPKKGALR